MLLDILNSAFSLIVLWAAVCAVNQMTAKTRFFIRAAYVLLGMGAFATLILPWLATPSIKNPMIPNLFMTMAVAIMVVWDRRRSMFRKNHDSHRSTNH